MTVSPEDLDGDLVAEPAGLLALAVAALQTRGRMVATDWEAGNFEVLPVVDGTEATVGIIRDSTQSVIFYQVWPEPVTDEQLPALVEFVVRANVELSTSCFELNPDSGILAVRSGLALSGIQQPWPADVAALLVNALDEVERVSQVYGDAVAAVTSGRSEVLDALATVGAG